LEGTAAAVLSAATFFERWCDSKERYFENVLKR